MHRPILSQSVENVSIRVDSVHGGTTMFFQVKQGLHD